MTSSSPPAEQMLKEIIEAQVNGGFDNFAPLADGRKICYNGAGYFKTGTSIITGGYSSAHLLEILLDPKGLKAAYGQQLVCEKCLNHEAAKCHCELEGDMPDIVERFDIAAHHMVDAWIYT